MAGDNTGAAVRVLAARLNGSVVTDGRSLADLEPLGQELTSRDRPLLRSMLLESLRWHHRLAWQLEQLVDKPLKRRDAELGALLRVGLVQLQFMRIPEHAAVSATVAASRALGFARASGLVNAVLRRFQRERQQLDAKMADHAVAQYSHPHWLLQALQRDWPEDWQNFVQANNEHPPLWLRINGQRSDRASYLQQLKAAGLAVAESSGPECAVLLQSPCPVESLPGFADGLVSVQDMAAQRVAGLMQLAPGLRVLDACAAPGGKAVHMLESCPDLKELVALDSSSTRLEQVRANLDRLGLVATLLEGDAAHPASWHQGELFDRILVDAPCTATGVIRRHPDIKLLRRETDIAGFAAQQAAMLEALWPLLQSGGRLVYATCSVLRAENFAVTEQFLAQHPDASLPAPGSAEHYQQLTGEAQADGFYYACLTKAADG